MVISCIGDSLTEGDYGVFGKSGIADVKERNYPFFLEKFAGASVRNFGKCGYTSTLYLERFSENGVTVEGSDVIIIMLGTNGGLSGEDPLKKGNLDYGKLIDLCLEKEPKAKIVVCTPPHATKDPKRSNFGYAAQVREGVEFVRNFARERGLCLIDTALIPEFTRENEDVMQPNDGLHFSEVGYYILAKFIYEGLKPLI